MDSGSYFVSLLFMTNYKSDFKRVSINYLELFPLKKYIILLCIIHILVHQVDIKGNINEDKMFINVDYNNLQWGVEFNYDHFCFNIVAPVVEKWDRFSRTILDIPGRCYRVK